MCEAKKKINIEIFVVTAFFLIGTIASYIIASKFCLVISFYPDEPLYYGIAQSIHDGTGLRAYNTPVTYNNILYSLLISPAFAFKDASARLSVIFLINSVCINAGVFPVYYLSRKFVNTRWCRIAACLVYTVYSYNDFTLAVLTESLWIPLMLCLMCVFCNIFTKQDEMPLKKLVLLNAGAGLLTYVCYFTKVVTLAVPVAYAAYLATELIYCLVKKRDTVKAFFKSRVAQFLSYAASFGIPYVILQMIVFSNVTNYTIRTSALEGKDDAFAYMLYAFFFYLCAAALTLIILPLLMPAVYFEKLSKNAQKFYAFLFWLLIVSVAVTVFTVTLPEDYPSLTPRVHLRYIAWIFVPFIIIFLHLTENKPDHDGRSIARKAAYMAPFFLLILAVYRDTNLDTPYDNTMFLTKGSGGDALMRFIFVIIIVCAVCVFLFHYKKTKQSMMIAVFLCLTLGCQGYERYVVAQKIIVNTGAAETGKKADFIKACKEYAVFTEEHSDEKFLIIDSGLTNINLIRDTFVFRDNVYKSSELLFEEYDIDAGAIVLNETAFPINFRFAVKPQYEPMDVDYLILRKPLEVKECDSVERLDEPSSEYYDIYKVNDGSVPIAIFKNFNNMASGDYVVTEGSNEGEYIIDFET